jgi:hypothetical protein
MWTLGRTAAVIAALALVPVGCAQIRRQEARQIEPQLSVAGFRIKHADTPEKLAKLRAMPQGKLQQTWREGKPYYVFADLKGCNCFYLGDQAAYDQYQASRVQSEGEIAVQDQDFESMDENAAPDWGMWGIDSW